MGSIGSSIGSSAAVVYFNGLSNFSSDLNNEISKEVQLASLPIEVLDNDVTNLSNQASELQTLNGDLSSVQSSVSNLASAAGNMLSASVSNSAVATATLGSGAIAGTYTLAVSSLGSFSDSISTDGLTTVTDPTSQNISTSSNYTLTVNGATVPLTLSADNLNGLAQAINNANANVQATVVNVGSNSAPDYRLSLQSNDLGPVTMQLNDGSQDLLEASGSPGTLAQYTVDGKAVSSNSDTVTLASGLTVNLTGETTGSPATITVAPNSSGVSNALQSFVSSYNAAISELNKNVGQSGGPLSGQSVVYNLINSLQGLANYSNGSSGNISSMAVLGLTFNDTTGQLSFNQSTFNAATNGQSDALNAFLGSATGGGFLGQATSVLNGIEDPTIGTLTTQINAIQSDITSTNTQITNEENQVTQLQTNLTQQMASADALIYSMQQQASQIQGILTAEQDSEIAGVA